MAAIVLLILIEALFWIEQILVKPKQLYITFSIKKDQSDLLIQI